MATKTTRVGTRVTASPVYRTSFDWDDFWEKCGFIFFGILFLMMLAKCSGAG